VSGPLRMREPKRGEAQISAYEDRMNGYY